MKLRKLSLLLSAVMLASALAGCASSASTASSVASQAASEPASAAASEVAASSAAGADETPSVEERIAEVKAAAAEIVYKNDQGQTVVSSKLGETVVPEDPQRIVVIKLEDLALALDIDMVACRNFETFYLEDEVNSLGIGQIDVDEEANTINFEQVMSYEPDLIIIRDAFDQSIYDELNKIAPTIAFRLQDYKTALMGLGMALDMEDEATARLEQFYEKVDSARETLKSVDGESVAMLRILKKEIRLYPYSKNDMSSFLYNELGLTPDPMTVEYDNADNLAISMETLPDLSADHIILIAGYGSQDAESVAAAKARYEEIKADPLWQMVPAVQSGSVFEVDSRVWLTHGLIATEMKIDEVLEFLA